MRITNWFTDFQGRRVPNVKKWEHVEPVTFEFYTLLGCLAWNIALVYLGWWLGSSWGIVATHFRDLALLVFFALIAFAFWINCVVI